MWRVYGWYACVCVVCVCDMCLCICVLMCLWCVCVLQLWDIRTTKASAEWKAGREFISDMSTGKNCRSLLATSGDGKLYKMDWRMDWTKKKCQHSDTNESELLCVDLVKVLFVYSVWYSQ